jgi:hypothetical protein
MTRGIYTALTLGALLLATTAGAQPFPIPQGPPGGGPTITHDSQGRWFETFTRPDGSSVTYGPGGTRYETFESPAGVVTTYGPHGQRYESMPGPAEAEPARRSR